MRWPLTAQMAVNTCMACDLPRSARPLLPQDLPPGGHHHRARDRVQGSRSQTGTLLDAAKVRFAELAHGNSVPCIAGS